MAFYSVRRTKAPTALILHTSLLAGLVGMMCVPSTLGLGLGIATLIGAGLLIRGQGTTHWNARDTHIALAFASLPLAYLASLLWMGGPLSDLDRPSRLLIAILAFLAIRHYGLPVRGVVLAAIAGLLLAASVALVQVVLLDWPRAAGDVHPIPFGNAALWLGGLVLAGAVTMSFPLKAWTAFSTLLALGASLLSGSRGGWIALPLFAYVLGLAHPRYAKRPLFILALVLAPLGFMGLLFLLASPLHERVLLAWKEAQYFFAHADQHPRVIVGSFDTRLEMWRVGLMAFLEAPWFGLGGPGLETYLTQGVAVGTIHPGLLEHHHLHNELVTTAARMGLLGLGALLTFWVGTWLFFWQTFRQANASPEAKFYATMGLIVLGGSIIFSLSDSMFGTYPGIHALALLLAMAAGGMRHAEITASSRTRPA